MDILIKRLKEHEGFKDRIYLDSEGKPTCGWGHHLWVGSRVPTECCEAFFKQDLADAVADFRAKIPASLRRRLNVARARVITEMIFQMGIAKVLGFKKMWAAIEKGDFEEAAKEMLDSKWANQCKYRSIRLTQIMREGKEIM